MRKLRGFEYLRPLSVAEATEMLRHYHERARVLAGGTDLLVSMKRGAKTPDVIVDIKHVRGLDHVTWSGVDGLRIGALFTVASAAAEPILQARFPLLVKGALAIGHPQVRNRATVVGNLCNASPSADLAPPLLALGARVHIAASGHDRVVPLERFFAGPFRTIVGPDELVTEVAVPPLAGRTGTEYVWMPKITAVDETLVGAAAVLALDDGRLLADVRLALGSIAPTPIRAWKAEAFLEGRRADDGVLREAARIAAADTAPRARGDYRRHLSALLVERALRQAVAQAA